jgi:hypothetical protein
MAFVLAPMAQAAPITPATGDQVTLSMFLNEDGFLNLPAEGIMGTIDPAGYSLVSQSGEAPRFAPAAAPSSSFGTDNANWDPRFAGSNGLNSAVHALAWDGSNLYVGGEFSTAGGVSANRIARWNSSGWSALGTGMNNPVFALAWDGSYLYAGGAFTNAGGVPFTSYIARWNDSGWSALDRGMNNPVYALAWDGANLYAGGEFTFPASRIARWNGSAWFSLASGTNNIVYALAWDGSFLYAGGAFTSPAIRVARWNGGSWSSVGSSVNSTVYALAW